MNNAPKYIGPYGFELERELIRGLWSWTIKDGYSLYYISSSQELYPPSDGWKVAQSGKEPPPTVVYNV